jgi:AcrR family transcriptional regulator
MHVCIIRTLPGVKEEFVVGDKTELGRAAQRRRTRKAIVEATAQLLERGVTPTVVEIASAADVSRRTVYMYFPKVEQLLLDATLGALSQAEVDHVLEPPELIDVGDRVEAMARVVQGMSPEVERLGRSLIRLTVEPNTTESSELTPRRGYRRVEWIETALAPLRDQLDAQQFDRLVAALAMVVGWEPLIVQRDICGLTAAQGEELSVWAARALVAAAVAEVNPSESRPQPSRMKNAPSLSESPSTR